MTVGGLLSVEAEIFVYGFLWGFIAGMFLMAVLVMVGWFDERTKEGEE